jgi:hypothetical protein
MGSIPDYIWIILLIVGLLLCFFGEVIWEFMVSILGAIIGSTIGYVIGLAMGNFVCAIGLMFIGSIIGSMLFRHLAKTAVALLLGLLAFGSAAYLAYTSGQSSSASFMIGLIVGVIIFVIAVIYVEEIVGVFLAAVGGFLVGVGVYFLAEGDSALVYAALAGGSMFILGAIFQVMYLRRRKGPSRKPPKREPARETKPATQTPREQTPPTIGPKPSTPKSSPSQPGSGSKVGDAKRPSH